jgi:hypothetical protein
MKKKTLGWVTVKNTNGAAAEIDIYQLIEAMSGNAGRHFIEVECNSESNKGKWNFDDMKFTIKEIME